MQKTQAFFTDFSIFEEIVTVKEAISTLRKNNSRLLVMVVNGVPTGICDSFDLLCQTQHLKQPVAYSSDFACISKRQILSESDLTNRYFLVQNEQQDIIGWLDNQAAETLYLKQLISEDLRELTTDLEAIVDSIYDEILVVDAKGIILRVSNRSTHNLWGVDPATVVGMNILDLEEKGWFKPTVTRRVLEEQKKISIIQENRLGKKILAVGNPIFGRKKKLERIVIASRDITEQSQLEKELKLAKRLTEKYRQEIDHLRKYQQVGDKPIVYQSDRMKELMLEIERIARVESTVAIYGESGVGKELIALAIHQFSPRSDQPFIKINCGSIPENLLESELFGYEKGAFTGALGQGKKGLFELADRGTLFLDEVAELPLNLQVKLLRAIQEREILKIGGSREIHVDVRIIAATNRNLEEMVSNGTFREDLYYRLHVIPLFIPALRERIEDIEPLVHYFVEHFNKKFLSKKFFSEDAIEMLKAYHWPGNVRQLQNIVERAIVTTPDPLITANELAKLMKTQNKSVPSVQVNSIIPLQQAVELTEIQLIQMALAKYKTITKVAEVLDVSQPTISRRFQKLINLSK